MNLSEATTKVIELAGKIRDYYTSELPKRHPNYPLIGPDEETTPPPPEEKELKDFLTSLSEDMISQLMVIMYIGRGDIGTDELAAYYHELKGAFGDREQAVDQFMGHAPLADYLSDALEELRKAGINVNKLPLKKVKAQKR